jgi:uncharacterized DUF497 family protein
MKIPRWAQVLIGVGIVAVFLGIGAIIAVTAWFSQNLHVQDADERDAEVEFEKVRQQFKGQPPLLELKDGAPHYVGKRTAASGQSQLQTLHVLVFDPRDDKLSRISIPWWILRMKSGPIRFGSYTSGLDDGGVNLTPEDIEKFGPGVILDTPGRHGERVLLWAQ